MTPAGDTDGAAAVVERVEVESGGATVVELSVRDRRVGAGAAGALFGMLYGAGMAEQAGHAAP
jgi:hypothetical protein